MNKIISTIRMNPVTALVVAFLGLAGLALLVIGCRQLGTPTTVAEVAVAEVVQQVVNTPAAAQPEATATEPVLEEATAEPVVDTCTDCHTDKEQLVAVADPIEELVEENEGAG